MLFKNVIEFNQRELRENDYCYYYKSISILVIITAHFILSQATTTEIVSTSSNR